MESPVGRINFNSGKELAIAIPDEEGRKTDILVFRQVSPILLILKSSWVSKERVCGSIFEGEDIWKALAGTEKVTVNPHLDGKVVKIGDTSQVFLLKQSNVLGYMAVKTSIAPDGSVKEIQTSPRCKDLWGHLEKAYELHLRSMAIVRKKQRGGLYG